MKSSIFPLSAISLSVLLLSGCAPGPSLTVHSGVTHPQLSKALAKASVSNLFPTCGGLDLGVSGDYRACRTDVLLDSAGPAPLVASSTKMGKALHANGLKDIMGGAAIGNGLAGGGVGGIAVGLFLLLGSSGSTSAPPPGLVAYQNGSLYAVAYAKTNTESKSLFIQAAHDLVSAPTVFAGQLSGWSGYTMVPGSVTASWFPHDVLFQGPSNSTYALYYSNYTGFQPRQLLGPVAVYRNDLRPMLKTYSVTDQWSWAPKTTRRARQATMHRLSVAYPTWTFVSFWGPRGNDLAANLVCKRGNCRFVHFFPYRSDG